MTHNYSLQVLGTAFALMCAADAVAINPPSIAQPLTDGDTYVLMNYARPTKYGTRTSWDGAYYLLDYAAWQGNTGAWQPISFTAHSNEDGTWQFTYQTTSDIEGEAFTTTFFLGIPAGSGNLKALEDTEVNWTVTAGDYANYYKLAPCADNPNDLVVGHPLHLNGSGEYSIIYYDGNGWGFDIYEGIQRNEDEEPVYEDEEQTFPVFANYDHTNWAFVHEADIDAYQAKMAVYEAIKDIEDNYTGMEGFDAGFQSLLATVTPIYEEGTALDDATAIIKAKKDFFNAIINATDQNLTDDAALNVAIEKATATFNASNDVTEIATASEALNNALKIYLSGDGDFTSFGKNMSFEDLSNQGGSATSSIVNAPAGWNLYLDGTLCNTAAEIKDAGIGAWCGINADGNGAKDGEYVFGIWNSAMPKVELSQTIDGLDNGSYLISAAVMVGANGNGSRMTTQRIFGNLNSALFGWEDDYNKEYLDPSEVYSYAELSEITTDTELQEMSVSAYVYDGTLTFGFRTDGQWKAIATREGGNGAGGDGWFKLDNFRIQYLGYDASDADNILSYYQDLLGEFVGEDMQTDIKTKAEALIALSPTTQDDMNAAILQCKDYISTVKASIDAYKAMAAYIEECKTNIDTYADYAGINDYEKAVLDASDQVDSYALDNEALKALRASLEDALNTLMLSGVSEGKDVTALIANPSFEVGAGNSGSVDRAPEGWTLTLNGTPCSTAAEIKAAGVTAWCASNEGDNISGKGLIDEDGNLIERQPTDGTHLFGIWNDAIPEVELSQTIAGLPAGTYTLTADVMVEWNWAGDCLTTQRIFANDAVCMFGYPEDYLLNATPDMLTAIEADRAAGFHVDVDDYAEDSVDEAATGDEDTDAYRLMNYARYLYQDDPEYSLLKTLTLKFVVGEDGNATIGFRTNGIGRTGEPVASGKGWFKVDNFTLYYENSTVPTAIAAPTTSALAGTIFNLSGIRLSAPQRGINIVRTANGVSKIVKK